MANGDSQQGGEMGKIILGNVFRNGLTAVITFLVTKHVIQADVAAHLMRGDTVALWNGTINLNMTMVVNILIGLAIPIVLPIALGIWSRINQAYATLVARSQAFQTSKAALETKVADATIVEKITAVATGTPTT